MTAPLTAEQIARKLGISNATVSRVLNNSPLVSASTRQAVLDAVRAAGASPRLLGPRKKPPADGPTEKLGIMQIVNVVRFPAVAISAGDNANAPSETRLHLSQYFSPSASLSTSFPRHIINGIVDELRSFNKRAVVQVVPNLLSKQLLSEVNDRDIQGVFLMGIYDADVQGFLANCRPPVVTFMTWDHDGWPDYVGIDNRRGIRLGFEHLTKLGHRKLGYVAGELRFSAVFHERLSSFKSLATDAGLVLRNDWIIEGSCDLGPIQERAEHVLGQADRPTAMLCCFDGAAVAVKRAADRLGLSIPRDLSVVGFDDEEIAQLFSPSLTTVRVPTHLMGRQAVQLMMLRQRRAIERGEGCGLRVTPSLIVRESTSVPPVLARHAQGKARSPRRS